MPVTDSDARFDEIEQDYFTVRDSFDDDIAEADKITDYKTKQGRKNEIKANFYAMRAIYWHAQAATLAKVGVAVERAFQAAVAARTAITDATNDEKDLVKRIKDVSDLVGAASSLFAKATS